MITASDKNRYNAEHLAVWGTVYDDVEGISWAGTKEKTLEYFPKKAVLSLFPLLKDGTYGSATETPVITVKDGRIKKIERATISGGGGEPLFLSWLGAPPNISTFTNDSGYLTTVSVDGTTITGDGTPGNPLVAAGAAEPLFMAWLAGPPNISEFTNDVGYITSWGPETDPIFTSWLAGPPLISTFTNDAGYITSIPPDYISSIADTATINLSVSGGGQLTADFTSMLISQFTNDSGYLTSVTAHNVLSATHGDTVAASVVRGDIIVGNATPKWNRLALGTIGKILRSDGSDLVYSTSTFADTYTINSLMYAGAANTIIGLTAANNGTLISNGSGVPTWLAAGTNGFVLTMTAGAPAWAAASGGGTRLDQVTAATATATIDSTDKAIVWGWDSLAGATAMKFSSTSTAAASNAQIVFEIALSGANGTSAQTTYGAKFSNTHTGTTSTNVALSLTASGGTSNNYALITTAGNVGINTTTPTSALLQVLGTGATSATTSFLIQNSATTTLFKVTDDGNINLKADMMHMKNSVRFLWSTTASNNVFLGEAAANTTLTGTSLTIMGAQAGQNLTSGINNTFVGFRAGKTVTTGSANTAVGTDAMNGGVTTGDDNTAIGVSALVNVTGSGNTALGRSAGGAITSGTGGTYLGYKAGLVSTGNHNVIIGWRTSDASLTTGTNNVHISTQATGATANVSSSICLNGVVDQSNIMVVGHTSFYVTDLYIGSGRSIASGFRSFTMQNSIASGTNIAATSSTLIFACARGTGTGDSGDILWSYSPAVASGSTLQTLVNGMTFDGATGTLSLVNDFKITTAGKGIYIKEGANATCGRAVLVGGTVVVNTNKVTANTEIFLTSNVDGGTPGTGVRVSARTAGVSFTITSINALDTGTVSWFFIEPA